MASQPDYQIIAINVLPNISRQPDNQICNLREYNMRNIFVEKSYPKCGEETIFRPFSK